MMGSGYVMKAVAEIVDELGELYLPIEHLKEWYYTHSTHSSGWKGVNASAGEAAHLAGMVAALSCHPAIGVPVEGSSTDGMDCLLSIVQIEQLAIRMLGAADSQYDNLQGRLLEKVQKSESKAAETVWRSQPVRKF
ncbi:hypothetical protein R1sor_000795 [Riccia sorocarpa]|uniref:phosphoribosylaminoimidazole carboxylase n=1 Tax=Riccia sorocarpa TaxID=122646 RepID=A0ABD3GU65_9MARC